MGEGWFPGVLLLPINIKLLELEETFIVSTKLYRSRGQKLVQYVTFSASVKCSATESPLKRFLWQCLKESEKEFLAEMSA